MEDSTCEITDLTLLKKIDLRFWAVLISSACFGLFAHGMMLFNKYSWHDDSFQMFGVGSSYSSGRWFLQIFSDFEAKFFGSGHFSTPSVNGIFCIFCIALMTYLLVRLFDIRSILICCGMAGILVTFPSVTGTFGYMFAAPFYLFAILMTVLGAYLICKVERWYTFLLGVLMIGSSVGIYQAYIPMAMTIMVFCFFVRVNKEEMTAREYLIYGIRLVLGIGLALVFYFLMNKLCLHVTQTELSGYQGINSATDQGMMVYLSRVKYAYKSYLIPGRLGADGVWDNMYPWRSLTFYYLQMAISLVLLARKAIAYIKAGKLRKLIQMGILVILFPLASNFIFVMTPLDTVYALTVYAQAFTYIFFAYLVDDYFALTRTAGSAGEDGQAEGSGEAGGWKRCIPRIILVTEIVLLLLTSVTYSRYDAACYLKAEITQTRAISFFNQMVSAIKTTEGYKDEYPVVFLNTDGIKDKNVREIGELNALNISPYFNMDGFMNSYIWQVFVDRWCAYKPDQVNESEVKDLPEVKSMPHYPDQGSIKVVNHIVVVNF